MTKTERLTKKLNALLADSGLKLDKGYGIDFPVGGQRREDCCRWNAYAVPLDDSHNGKISIASWDTVTECVRGDRRLVITTGGEAQLMIYAYPHKKLRVYFAHPVTDYDTQWEKDALSIIDQIVDLDRCEVVNPNTPEHDAGYKARGMAYFIDLCNSCDTVIWSPFPNGKVGAGVYKEVQSFVERDSPQVQMLDRDFNTWERAPRAAEVLTVDATRTLIKELRQGDTP